MANSPFRTYTYFTMVNPDNDLVYDNFHISVYMENNSFESSIPLMQDLLPVSILIPQFIQFTENMVALRALFDSGGTVTLVHARVLTNSVIPTQHNPIHKHLQQLPDSLNQNNASYFKTLYSQSSNRQQKLIHIHVKCFTVHALMTLLLDVI